MIFSCQQCGGLWAPSYDALRWDAKENSREAIRPEKSPIPLSVAQREYFLFVTMKIA
jgi:hypothetical protein